MSEETEIIEKSGLNKDLLQLFVRKILTLFAGYLTMHGIVDQTAFTTSTIDTLVGAVCIVISIIWSKIHQTKLKKGTTSENTPKVDPS